MSGPGGPFEVWAPTSSSLGRVQADEELQQVPRVSQLAMNARWLLSAFESSMLLKNQAMIIGKKILEVEFREVRLRRSKPWLSATSFQARRISPEGLLS